MEALPTHNRGWNNLLDGVERKRRMGVENLRRVLDALVRISGGVRAVPTADVRAATRRQGVGLSRLTVWRHLRRLEAEGRVVQEPGTGRGAKAALWRPSAIVTGGPR